MTNTIVDFDLGYEYINDADLARAVKFEQRCRAEKRRLQRWFDEMRAILIIDWFRSYRGHKSSK